MTFALSAACFFPCSLLPSFLPPSLPGSDPFFMCRGVWRDDDGGDRHCRPININRAAAATIRPLSVLLRAPPPLSLALIYLCLRRLRRCRRRRRLCHQCIVKRSAQSAFSSPLTPHPYAPPLRARLSIFFHMRATAYLPTVVPSEQVAEAIFKNAKGRGRPRTKPQK